MELEVESGKTIKLPAEFFSGEAPIDPASPRVTILDSKGAEVVSNGVPARVREGIYRYNYAVPAAGPTGIWRAVWSASIDGVRVSASDLFEVHPAPTSTAATPQPVTPATAPRPVTKPADVPGPPPSKPVGRSAPAAKPADSPKQVDRTRRAAEPPTMVPASGRVDKPKSTAPEKAAKKEKRPGKSDQKRRRRDKGTVDEAPASVPRSRLSGGKVLAILVALGIVLASIWFSPRRQDDAQAKIDQGVAAQKAGRTGEAQKLYEEVLKSDPDNKLANYNLGVAAHVAGDLDRAESLYLKSLQADANFLPSLFNLAILQENAGRNDESEETYRRLLEKYPDNGPAHLNYGFLLTQKMNKPDEGREEFRKAVELNPDLAARIPPEFRPAPAPAP